MPLQERINHQHRSLHVGLSWGFSAMIYGKFGRSKWYLYRARIVNLFYSSNAQGL